MLRKTFRKTIQKCSYRDDNVANYAIFWENYEKWLKYVFLINLVRVREKFFKIFFQLLKVKIHIGSYANVSIKFCKKMLNMSNFFKTCKTMVFENLTFDFYLKKVVSRESFTCNYYLYECKHIVMKKMKESVYPPPNVVCFY